MFWEFREICKNIYFVEHLRKDAQWTEVLWVKLKPFYRDSTFWSYLWHKQNTVFQ